MGYSVWPLADLKLRTPMLEPRHAVSSALQDNPSSIRVSHKLGHRDDGIEHYVVRGRAMMTYRLRLTRADWEAARSVPVEIEGLAPCLPHFGVPA